MKVKAPLIRFKEFAEEWKEVDFSKIFEEVNERTSDTTNYPLFSLTLEKGVTPKSERYERSFLLKKDEDNYKIVKNDEFVYNPMNLTLGAVARYNGGRSIAVSGYYNVFRTKEGFNSGFFENLLRTGRMILQYKSIATGSLIEKQRVHFSQFIKIKRPIPSLLEQKKIGDFFSLLNRKIEKQREKIEQLEMFKRGMIQKVFSQEIRFEGFTQPWEIKRLDELCSINPKSSKIPERFLYIDLESVEKGRICKKLEVVEKESAPSRAQRLLQVGDILYQMVRPYQMNNFQFIEEGSIPTVASTGYAQLRSKKSSGFLYQLIHAPFFVKEVLLRCTGSSYPAINTSDLSEIEVEVPVDIEEQMKIANFLSTIDKKINYEVEKLVLLENYKKGFLENMFV